jgi:hypothetical protein
VSGTSKRGDERLLRDCARVGRLLADDRPPAQLRLAEKVGALMARELLLAVRRRPLENGR